MECCTVQGRATVPAQCPDGPCATPRRSLQAVLAPQTRSGQQARTIDTHTYTVQTTNRQVLSRYIAYRHAIDPSKLAGKKVLELGSGTGLVGIVAAMLEPTSEVWVTDQE